MFYRKVKMEVRCFVFKSYADNLNAEKYILKCESLGINKSVGLVYRSNNSTNILKGGRSPTLLGGRYIYK